MRTQVVGEECSNLRSRVDSIFNAFNKLERKKARLFIEAVYDFISRYYNYFSLCGMQRHLDQLLNMIRELEKRLDEKESAIDVKTAKEELGRMDKALDIVLELINNKDFFKTYGGIVIDLVFGISAKRAINLSKSCRGDEECLSLYSSVNNKMEKIKDTLLRSSGISLFSPSISPAKVESRKT